MEGLSPGVTQFDFCFERITLASLLDLDCKREDRRKTWRPTGGCYEIWMTEDGGLGRGGGEVWSDSGRTACSLQRQPIPLELYKAMATWRLEKQ